MREISVRISDDLDWTRTGARNEAAVTLAVGLDGRWTELDLTEANEKLVRDILDELMAAGHEPEEPPKPPDHPGRNAFFAELRQWVRETGLKNSSGTGWAYQTNTSGQDYIGNPLVRKYQAYLDGQGKEKKGK